MDPYPFNDFGGFGGGFGTVAPGKSIYMSLAQSFLYDQRRSKVRLRIHQTFSKTFFVFFRKICQSECNTTSDWLIISHSNSSRYRKIWTIRQRMF